MDEIAKRDPESEITCINKELREFRELRDGENLYRYASAGKKAGRANALFIDEIQEIKGFEEALRSLLAKGGWDIYCTGSNAELLSGELATLLAGRHVEVQVHPLSYGEFLRFHGLTDSRESLGLYLLFGGLPYLSAIGLSEVVAFEYLDNVHASILLRDVVAREKIRNVDFLETLLEYVADNVGKLLGNAVFLRLVERGFDVTVGWLDGLEIDFVAEKAGRRLYVQAAYLIPDEATATREFGNLERIDDNYPKYVVSMDETVGRTDVRGIRQMNLRDFLLADLDRE